MEKKDPESPDSILREILSSFRLQLTCEPVIDFRHYLWKSAITISKSYLRPGEALASSKLTEDGLRIVKLAKALNRLQDCLGAVSVVMRKSFEDMLRTCLSLVQIVLLQCHWHIASVQLCSPCGRPTAALKEVTGLLECMTSTINDVRLMIGCEASGPLLLLGATTELLALWSKFLRVMSCYSKSGTHATKELLTIIMPFLRIAPISAKALISPGACYLVFTRARVGYPSPVCTADWVSRLHCQRIMLVGARYAPYWVEGNISKMHVLLTPRLLPWRGATADILHLSLTEGLTLRKTISRLKVENEDLVSELWDAGVKAVQLITEADDLRHTLRQLRKVEDRLVPISCEMLRVEEELEGVQGLFEHWCPKTTALTDKRLGNLGPSTASSVMVKAMIQDLEDLSNEADSLTLANDRLTAERRVLQREASRDQSRLALLDQEVEDLKITNDNLENDRYVFQRQASKDQSELVMLKDQLDDLRNSTEKQRAAIQKEREAHKKQLQEERDKHKPSGSSRSPESVMIHSSYRNGSNNKRDRPVYRKDVARPTGSQVMAGQDDDLMSVFSGASDKKIHGLRPSPSYERLPYLR